MCNDHEKPFSSGLELSLIFTWQLWLFKKPLEWTQISVAPPKCLAFYHADTVQSASIKNALHTVCWEISWRWLLSKLHIIVSSKHRLQPSGCQSKTVVSSSDCLHSELYLSHYIPLWFQWMPFSSFPFTCPSTLYTQHRSATLDQMELSVSLKQNKQNPENFIEWVEKKHTFSVQLWFEQ